MYTYKRAVVGGTFDHFHLGHQQLLTMAFEHSEKVVIGLSTEKLYAHKSYASLIQSYELREQAIRTFLAQKQLLSRAQIVPLESFYGITDADASVEAIFVTEVNLPNVEKMNDVRMRKGYQPLEAIVMPYVRGNDGSIITAEKVRSGRSTRDGHQYKDLFASREVFRLPESLREQVREPLGELFPDVTAIASLLTEDRTVVAVGDIISQTIAQHRMQADISIIDHRTRRHALPTEDSSILLKNKAHTSNIYNASGTIHRDAVSQIEKAFKICHTSGLPQVLIVDGEEDLLALPAILLAPLDSLVLYGQPDEGIVGVHVTEEKKQELALLLHQFE